MNPRARIISDGETATRYCVDCAVDLCPDCTKIIHSHRALSKHLVIGCAPLPLVPAVQADQAAAIREPAAEVKGDTQTSQQLSAAPTVSSSSVSSDISPTESALQQQQEQQQHTAVPADKTLAVPTVQPVQALMGR